MALLFYTICRCCSHIWSRVAFISAGCLVGSFQKDNNMAAAHYKQQDHIRRVSARSFLTNISLDGSHRDTCYGKLVVSRRHNVHVDADAVAQDNRLTQPICPVSGLELSDMIGLDLPAADSNAADGSADSKVQISSESVLIRCMSAVFCSRAYSCCCFQSEMLVSLCVCVCFQ